MRSRVVPVASSPALGESSASLETSDSLPGGGTVDGSAGELAGVMGTQDVRNVTLVRHAYVLTTHQRRGIGEALLKELKTLTKKPVLIGTWATARWAIRFYEKHGFRLVSQAEQRRLLLTYWRIPERQIQTSVVLADQHAGAMGIASVG